MQKIKSKRAIQNRVLRWFDSKQRDLPWLKNPTPYRIWVSEIMLQQTQIVTVVDYYKRFLKRFPTVKELAAANIEDVLILWEGLGYYRRARQLHTAAQTIVETFGGIFPTQFDDVLALPGVGRYTAAAILSISQNQPHAILEGNTIRLFARLMALRQDVNKSQTQKLLWSFSEQLLNEKRPGDFNQALMDLGREVCRPKNPCCEQCPLSAFCAAFIRGAQSQIPAKDKRIQYEDLREAIVVVERKQKVLMRKCQDNERWAGLWDFPRVARESGSTVSSICERLREETGLQFEIQSLNKTIKHAVTKYRIRLDCFQAVDVRGRLASKNSFTWFAKTKLKDLPLSASGRKIADLFVC